MARTTPQPPELLYKYVEPDDPAALNDVFNYLFDKFFAEIEKKSKTH